MKTSFKVICGITLLGLTGVAALAHSGATGIIKERMDMMSQITKDTKAMVSMVRGKADIDWEAVKKAGEHAAMTGEHFPMKFPEGSFKAPSEAAEAILTDPEGFKEQSQALWDAGTALIEASDAEDEEAFKSAFTDYTKTCKACHSDYRI